MTITSEHLSKIKKDVIQGPRGFPGAPGGGTNSSIELGETSTTAYRGDRGKTAYDHSQATHAPATAEQNVQPDWNQSTSTADDYIKNKPTIPVVSDVAYDATSWNDNTDAPTKNAVRDKFESLGTTTAPTAWGKYF